LQTPSIGERDDTSSMDQVAILPGVEAASSESGMTFATSTAPSCTPGNRDFACLLVHWFIVLDAFLGARVRDQPTKSRLTTPRVQRIVKTVVTHHFANFLGEEPRLLAQLKAAR
jgi:hypothetical protein